MISVIDVSELTLSLLLFWTLLLCVIGIFSTILSITQKRYAFTVLALIPFFCSYYIWQILFDIHLFGDSARSAPVSRGFGEIPFVFLALSLVFLTAAGAAVLVLTVRCGRHTVTPNAVKHCLDRMPCGICCWRDDGRVLFSNVCMNRLCADITGSPLLSGNQFYDAVADGMLTAEGKRWRFTCREIVFDGERLHEMIASDITAEYAETQKLSEDKAELSRLNLELKEYTQSIDDTVRRREILQAKVNIHDEMNRLMLSTVAAKCDDAAELDRIFTLWKQNALLLCMEADEIAVPKAAIRIEKLAEVLKIRLVRKNELPAELSEKQRTLFFAAAQEAIANAAKHARAKGMEISFESTDKYIACTFTNDGQIPTGEVRVTGGLGNLSLRAGKQNAQVFAEAGDTFSLTLKFMKNQPDG